MTFGWLRRITLRSRHSVKRLAHGRDGVAAIEFAMIVPIMITMFIGSVELSQAITVDRRVSQVTSTTADLIARADKNISCTDLRDMLNISSWLMTPYRSDYLDMTVRNITSNGAGTLNQVWKTKYTGPSPGSHNGSDPCTSAALSCPASGTTTTPSPAVDPSLVGNNGGLVVVDTNYDYRPLIFDFFLKRTLTASPAGAGIYRFSETSNQPPRGTSAKLTKSDGTTCG